MSSPDELRPLRHSAAHVQEPFGQEAVYGGHDRRRQDQYLPDEGDE